MAVETAHMLRAYGVTDRGHVRPTNEDFLAIDERRGLLVVADGLGGHNAGEIAARVAVETVIEWVAGCGADELARSWPLGFDPDLSEAGNRLRTAVHLANLQVLEHAASCETWRGMATTIVAALVEDGRLSIAHVGDSRLYVIANARMRQLTQDDSWTATMLAEGASAERAALRQHPMRHALTNVVGARARTEVHVAEEALEGGELLVLSTDGVHDVLDEDRIEQLVRDGGDVRQMASDLVDAALARGSRDNCTALVARYLAS